MKTFMLFLGGLMMVAFTAPPYTGTNCDDYARGVYDTYLSLNPGSYSKATQVSNTAFGNCMNNGGYSEKTVELEADY